MFLLLLLQNTLSWIIYYILLKLYLFLLSMVTLWWNLLSNMSMVFLVSYSTSTFLLVSLFYSSFSNIYHNHPNIFLSLLLLPVTSSFLLLILLSSIFFHIQLPTHYNTTRLSLLLTLCSLAYTSFFLLILSLLLSTIHPLSIL